MFKTKLNYQMIKYQHKEKKVKNNSNKWKYYYKNTTTNRKF